MVKELVDYDIRMLCEWKGFVVGELKVWEDHIRLLVSVPPKVLISKLMDTLNDKIAIKHFKSYPKLKQKAYWGNHFWARDYFVSTVGLDKDTIRKYVKYQEREEKRVEDQQKKLDF